MYSGYDFSRYHVRRTKRTQTTAANQIHRRDPLAQVPSQMRLRPLITPSTKATAARQPPLNQRPILLPLLPLLQATHRMAITFREQQELKPNICHLQETSTSDRIVRPGTSIINRLPRRGVRTRQSHTQRLNSPLHPPTLQSHL